MLRHTFCHIRGIGPTRERRLWDSGMLSWDDIAATRDARIESLRPQIDDSLARMEAGDAQYFAQGLPSAEQWRMFPEFRDSIAYLDIETTGLSPAYDTVTTVAVYDGRAVRHYVAGVNLEDLADDLAEYRALVTYNGKSFDVPFLRQALGLRLDQAHIDLRHVLRSLGYSGGLKGCEFLLGLTRTDTQDIDGYMAVLLWRLYEREHNERALETLLAYNVEDVLTLERLMVIAYNTKLRDTPFRDELTIPSTTTPTNPFRVDRPTVSRLSSQWG